MRISDWSSDVCSSDLCKIARAGAPYELVQRLTGKLAGQFDLGFGKRALAAQCLVRRRSEERRLGKECVSTCGSRWSAYPSKQKETRKQKIRYKTTPLKQPQQLYRTTLQHHENT